jgi:hypothetical protein
MMLFLIKDNNIQRYLSYKCLHQWYLNTNLVNRGLVRLIKCLDNNNQLDMLSTVRKLQKEVNNKICRNCLRYMLYILRVLLHQSSSLEHMAPFQAHQRSQWLVPLEFEHKSSLFNKYLKLQ